MPLRCKKHWLAAVCTRYGVSESLLHPSCAVPTDDASFYLTQLISYDWKPLLDARSASLSFIYLVWSSPLTAQHAIL